MDYVTKPVSRERLRVYAEIFRELFIAEPDKPFPVLEALEQLPEVFEGSSYRVVEDDELPDKVVAQCEKNDGKGFVIVIKKYIYDGARLQHIGAYLGFILHEMCHIYLYELGYVPYLQRSFDENTPIYCSVEWQAKALAGEVAMPYKETENMSISQIMETYNVSKGFAIQRKRYREGVMIDLDEFID